MRIVAAGGGTGGHLYPALAILEAMSKITEIEVMYFALKRGIESSVLPQEHPEYERITIDIRGLERPLFKPINLKRVLKIWRIESIILSEMSRFAPDAVLVTGGYISIPVGRVALKLGIPLFVQEQNAIPGLANRILARSARKVFVGFEETTRHLTSTAKRNVIVTGNPVRESCSDFREEFGDDYILVFGGSRGSDFINQLMEQLYEHDKTTKFVHSTGSKEWAERLSRFGNVRTFEYIQSMKKAWEGAKAAVTRAGALTVSEMLYYGVPCVLIPWEGAAGNHQLFNALYAEKLGRAKVLRECAASLDSLKASLIDAIALGRVASMNKINPALEIGKTILEECK